MKFIMDQDLHCHTHLSFCSADPDMNPQSILRHAQDMNYRFQCITDHYWDEALPMKNGWYQEQNTPHVKEDLALYPEDTGDVTFLFGCETDVDYNGVVGVSKEKFDDFGFIVVPPNHLHLDEIMTPGMERTAENLAKLFSDRLDLLSRNEELPWHKVGIAHLNFFYSGEPSKKAIELMDPDRMAEIFKRFAEKGAGIELNSDCFVEEEYHWMEEQDVNLKLFRIARDAGCKFYCGSDAHAYTRLIDPKLSMETCLRPVVDILELTEDDKFIPEVKAK